MFVLTKMNISTEVSYVVYSVLGNLLAYILDILFAKKRFIINEGYKGVKPYIGDIDYNAYGIRINAMLKSLFSIQFFRFSITVLIDIIIALFMIHYITNVFDKNDIHFWMRDYMISISVALFSFILYLNALRFDWAYQEIDNPVMNMLVIMWLTIIFILFVMWKTRPLHSRDDRDTKQKTDVEHYDERDVYLSSIDPLHDP